MAPDQRPPRRPGRPPASPEGARRAPAPRRDGRVPPPADDRGAAGQRAKNPDGQPRARRPRPDDDPRARRPRPDGQPRARRPRPDDDPRRPQRPRGAQGPGSARGPGSAGRPRRAQGPATAERPRRPPRPPGAGRRPRRADRRRDGSLLWRARRVLFVAGFLAFVLVAGGFAYLAQLPLPNPHPQAQTSYVYSANHQLLTTYQIQNRTDVPLSEVPKVVIDAVTSTEDRHFFHEGAVNPISTVRALLSDLLGSGGLQGGSTITQQYVKQAYLNSQRTITRKIKEAFIAIKLDHTESKDEILQGYLNTIYFGRGAYGIQAAAQTYFGRDVSQLGLPQASLLAGLIREPDIADPAIDPSVARTNQDDTLAAMVRDNQITQAQADAVEHMAFRSYVLPATDGGSTLDADVAGDQYFLDAVHAQLVATYGANEVASGGLRVTTTLDPTAQADAYAAMYGDGPNALDPAKGDPSGAVVSIDDQGDVRALVGGQNYATSQVDLALGSSGGGSGRQAGSTFKAFMLAELIKQGYSVESTLQAPKSITVPDGNAPLPGSTVATPWTVGNFEGESESSAVSIIEATALSLNTVYAQIVEKLGAASLDQMAESLGIAKSQLPGAYPSTVLGTAAVSPLEMADAYAAFADGGVWHSPVLITKVTTSTGKVLPLPASSTRTVLTPAQDSVLDYVLQQVVLGGTGGAAGGIGSQVAGKTGTTDSSADAWFVGYTPKLTTAVWMGYPKGEIPMVDFRGLSSVQGGTIPAAIWHDAMAAILHDEPGYAGSFPVVESLAGATLTAPTNVIFPTTTTSSTSTTTTTVPKTTTTLHSTTTSSPATTSPATTTPVTTPPTTPPTTSAPTTTTPTTSPPSTAPPTTTAHA